MKLNAGLHLAYTTNVHRGETWAETFEALKNYTLPVRDRVDSDRPFGIGLRLSNRAAHELRETGKLLEFQRWLGQNQCYVFTMNGFQYGQFRPGQIKDRVYAPDWVSPERLAYTNLLFDLLAHLVPVGMEGSVSTLPCSFKGYPLGCDELKMIRTNLWRCVEHIARLSEQTGRRLHLGLEPEPLCLLESSGETIQFFDRLRAEHPRDPRLAEHLGVNYDACHFAVEFEDPLEALPCLRQHGIKISKIHISSALRAWPTADARRLLAQLANEIYLHQVVVRQTDGQRVIYRDLDEALTGEPVAAEWNAEDGAAPSEWRIHFHVPLHNSPEPPLDHTNEHVLGVLDLLGDDPHFCSHLEMETYTWEILPPELKDRALPDLLAAEYAWTLGQLAERGLN